MLHPTCLVVRSAVRRLSSFRSRALDHPESKFENGHKSGAMRRRHIVIDSIRHIGKEANEIEDIEQFGARKNAYAEYAGNNGKDLRSVQFNSA